MTQLISKDRVLEIARDKFIATGAHPGIEKRDWEIWQYAIDTCSAALEAELLERLGQGFEDFLLDKLGPSALTGGTMSIYEAATMAYQAGAASREAEVAALREEVERLKAKNAAVSNIDEAIDKHLFNQLLATQAQAKRYQEALNKVESVVPESYRGYVTEALSTPINTTEIDALVKDVERYRWLRTYGNINQAAGLVLDYEEATLDAAIDAAIKESGLRLLQHEISNDEFEEYWAIPANKSGVKPAARQHYLAGAARQRKANESGGV